MSQPRNNQTTLLALMSVMILSAPAVAQAAPAILQSPPATNKHKKSLSNHSATLYGSPDPRKQKQAHAGKPIQGYPRHGRR